MKDFANCSSITHLNCPTGYLQSSPNLSALRSNLRRSVFFCNFILHTSSFTLAEWPPRDRSRRCKHPQIFLRIKRRSPESNTVGTLKEPRPIDCTKPRGIDLLGTPQFYLVLSWWTHLLLSPRKRLNRINHCWKKGT